MNHRPLSHSAREQFGRCERLYFLSEIERVELDQDKPALRMGKAFALCNEKRDPRAADAEYFHAISETRERGDQLYEKLEEQLSIVRVYSAWYQEKYSDDWEHDLQREVEFHSPIVGHGYLDGIMLRHGERIGIEDKLLSPISWRSVNEEVLKIDGQVSAYYFAMRELGIPLDKLIYRVQIKPGIGRRHIKMPETELEYEARLRQYLMDKPELFKQYEVYRTDEQLDLFALQAKATNAQVNILKRLQKKHGADVWPQRTKACSDFGGCAMLPLCRDDPGAGMKYRLKSERPKPLPNGHQKLLKELADTFAALWTGLDIAEFAGLSYSYTMSALRMLEKQGFVTSEKVGRSLFWGLSKNGTENQ